MSEDGRSGRADVRLYELVLANGRSASPYVWRIRYALAHKGIPFESVALGFTDIPAVLGARSRTVPVLEHGEQLIRESWDIAEYLDRAFPGTPLLFSSPAERAMVRLMDEWFVPEIMRKMLDIYVLDIHDAVRPQDRPYFRQSRETRLRAPLEAHTAERRSRLPVVRAALAPLRAQLARHTYLGGDAPNYADYISLGAFLWIGSVSTLPLIARDDEIIRTWLDRGFALYGGLALDSRLQPLVE
jgi:glutathione S-transferase